MVVLSKIESRFEQLLPETHAVRLCKKENEQVRIDCLKTRSNKDKSECKNCGCTNFYVFDYQNSSYKIFSIW